MKVVYENSKSEFPKGTQSTISEGHAGASDVDRVYASQKLPKMYRRVRPSKIGDERSLYGVICRFFTAPIPRQVWAPDGESVDTGCPHVGWMELFLDLVFVGFFVVLAEEVEHCDDFGLGSMFFFFTHFTLLWGTRNLMDAYLNRFSLSHNLTMCAFFLFTGGLMLMIINTGDSACGINGEPLYVLQGFAAGFLLSRLTVLGLCVYTYYHNRELLGDVVFDGAMISVQCTLIIASVYNTDVLYVVAGVDLVFGPLQLIFNSAAQYLFPAWKQSPHPVNHSMIQERQAVWVVLVLGESIIDVAKINPEEMSEKIVDMYIFTTGTAVLMFAIGGAYFETCCVHEHGHTDRIHALRRNKWSGAFWTCGQNVLSFGIFLIGPITALILHGFRNYEETHLPGETHHERRAREHAFEKEQEEDIFEHSTSVGVVLCTIHMMLILLSRVHENFIHPMAGLSEWRLDAKPWYVAVEVSFAMLHLAVGHGPRDVDAFAYETWTPIVHTLLLVAPRLIVSVQQIFYVLADVRDKVIDKIDELRSSSSIRKSVDLHSLRRQDSHDCDTWVRNDSKKGSDEDDGGTSPLHQDHEGTTEIELNII